MEIDKEILSLNPDELETDEKTKALMRKVLDLLEQILKENAELRVEIQKLRDKNARLKGE
jgi:regulator of replication initiation timing